MNPDSSILDIYISFQSYESDFRRVFYFKPPPPVIWPSWGPCIAYIIIDYVDVSDIISTSY